MRPPHHRTPMPGRCSTPDVRLHSEKTAVDWSTALYHSGQESKQLLESIMSRDAELFERKRRAEFKQKENLSVEERMVERIPMDRDVTLTTQVQLYDHATLLRMTQEGVEQADYITKIRQELNVLFTFSDLSLSKFIDAPKSTPYTSVTIKGALQDVEAARSRLQKIIPITVALPLDSTKLNRSFSRESLTESLDILRKEKHFCFPSISVKVGKGPCISSTEFCSTELERHRRSSSSSQPSTSPEKLYLTVTGASGDSSNLIECVQKLRDHFYKKDEAAEQTEPIVGTLLDIPSEFRGYAVGQPEGIFMRFLSTFSNTLIHFPSSANTWPNFIGATFEMPEKCRSTTYYISGKIENVIKCFLMLQEALPVSLKFNVEEEDLIEKVRTNSPSKPEEGELLNHFDDSWKLHVHMHRNTIGGEQIYAHDCKRYTGVITTTLANINRMYGYRRAIMVAASKGPRISVTLPVNFEGEKPLRKFITENTKFGFKYSKVSHVATRPVYSVCGL